MEEVRTVSEPITTPSTSTSKDSSKTKQMDSINEAATAGNKVKGKALFQRTHAIFPMIDLQKKHQLWLYFKTALSSPSAITKGHDIYGNVFEGPNFATQDYLGLNSSPEVREVAMQVVKDFGVHSGGAALAFGTHPWYLDFQKEVADYWGVKSVIIYSTGWMAGFGVIKGLIKSYDHIVMDKLAHNCLQEGAKAATRNVNITEHLNVQEMINKVKEIRAQDNENAILVVTESLFSMDSDTPDLALLQKECKKYDAYLLIDMAHDFGAIGKVGLGALETQNITDLSNVILIGSGSKVLSSNIGFVGCNDERVIEYMRYFSSPYMFSNVVAPPQCAVALHNIRVARSPKGAQLREKVMDNAIYLREQLTKRGFEVIGNPSPIVILLTGDELLSRIVSRLMLNSGVIVNGIEYPIVPKGKARLRLQLQAVHTHEHLDLFVETFIKCYDDAQKITSNLSSYIEETKAKL